MLFVHRLALRLPSAIAVLATLFALGCGGRAQGGAQSDVDLDASAERVARDDATEGAPTEGGSRDASRDVDRDASADGPRPRDAAVTADAADVVGRPVDAPPPIPAIRSLTITPQAIDVPPGQVVPLTVVAVDDQGQSTDVSALATFFSSPIGVVDMVGNVATARRAGTVQITAAWRGALANTSITVQGRTVVSIAVSSDPRACESRETITFRAVAKMSDGFGEDVTSRAVWSSSNPMVVEGSSTARCIAPGSALVTAELNGIRAELKVDVGGVSITKYFVGVPPVLRPLEARQLLLRALYADGDLNEFPSAGVTFTSSDPGVIDVTPQGQARAILPGTALITASIGSTVVASAKVPVSNANLVSVTLAPKTQTITYPAIGELTATGLYSDGMQLDVTRSVGWETVGPLGVGGGVVTAYGTGTMTAVAHSDEGIVSNVVDVTVLPGAPTELAIDDMTIPQQLSRPLVATATYASGAVIEVGDSVTWRVTDGTIVTLTGRNVVGTRAGRTGYYATLGALTSLTRNLTVTAATLLSIELDTLHLNLAIGELTQIQVIGTFDDGSQEIAGVDAVFKTGNVRIAMVSNDPATRGLVTGVSVGTTTLTATLGAFTTTTTVTVY